MITKETKKLFETRAKYFVSNHPQQQKEKCGAAGYGREDTCRQDYRSWMTKWVQKIEAAEQ